MVQPWIPREALELPDGLILFDGVCVLCSWWVRFIVERDAAARFRFAPIQSPLGGLLADALRIDRNMPETNALIADGRAYFKADAAIRILAELPHWRWARACWLVPRPVRDWIYDRVARNRYYLFGQFESCPVPSGELRRRVLTELPAGLGR